MRGGTTHAERCSTGSPSSSMTARCSTREMEQQGRRADWRLACCWSPGAATAAAVEGNGGNG